MAAPTLADYQYQYKDTGILLNGDTSPFWDVEKVTGLDFPALTAYDSDYDGAHGGFLFARYFDQRTIVIEGTCYATAATIDTQNENMKAALVPDGVEYPLYIKQPAFARRYINAIPLDYKSDVDTGRRIGIMPFQIQFGCADPTIYMDNANQTMALDTNYTVANAGSTESFPTITLTGIFDTLNVFGPDGNNMVFSVSSSASSDVVVFDTFNRQVRKNGVDVTNTYTSGTWPSAAAGNTTWRVTVGSGTPTIVLASKSAWI